jgi:hypothetical protein
MFHNLREFNLALNGETKVRIIEKFKLKQKLLALKLFEKIVLKTPVDTGRARNAWEITINVIPEDENALLSDAESFEDLEFGQMESLEDLKFGQIIVISNNVPYIQYLENGHSKQAPKGMVALSIQSLKDRTLG